EAGLVLLDPPPTLEDMRDLDRLAAILAQQTPSWPPGSRHGYHGLTIGMYMQELLRRVDPVHRSLGRFFRDEIALPLGIEFYIGLPTQIPERQLAVVQGFPRIALLGHLNTLPPKFVLAAIWPQSLVARSVQCLRINNPA